MGDMYRVTPEDGRVVEDHPDGYQVVAAVPGDEIPVERARALGLVKEAAPTGAVQTAEVRRGDLPAEEPVDETAAAPDEDEDEGPSAPAKNALKDEWLDYAESTGADRSDIEHLTKDELIAQYGDG